MLLFLTTTAAFICGVFAAVPAILLINSFLDREFDNSPLSKNYD